MKKIPLYFLLPLTCLALFFFLNLMYMNHFMRSSTGTEQDEKSFTTSLAAAQDNSFVIPFTGFDDHLIPSNSVLDINIGTNLDPLKSQDGRYRILVDPLFYVCENNAKITVKTTTFCFAVANYTGFTTFFEYNGKGVSSSLSRVSAGTSHERLKVKTKRTVLVLEARILFDAISQKKSTIHRLKLDMQGYELMTLKNILPLLQESDFVTHIKAECFKPNKDGVQIYQVDNSCESIATLLQTAGYETRIARGYDEWSDVTAYKKGMTTTFLPQSSFAGSMIGE